MSSDKRNATPGFDPTRRSFLSAMAAAAGVTLAPGVILYGISQSSISQGNGAGCRGFERGALGHADRPGPL